MASGRQGRREGCSTPVSMPWWSSICLSLTLFHLACISQHGACRGAALFYSQEMEANKPVKHTTPKQHEISILLKQSQDPLDSRAGKMGLQLWTWRELSRETGDIFTAIFWKKSANNGILVPLTYWYMTYSMNDSPLTPIPSSTLPYALGWGADLGGSITWLASLSYGIHLVGFSHRMTSRPSLGGQRERSEFLFLWACSLSMVLEKVSPSMAPTSVRCPLLQLQESAKLSHGCFSRLEFMDDNSCQILPVLSPLTGSPNHAHTPINSLHSLSKTLVSLKPSFPARIWPRHLLQSQTPLWMGTHAFHWMMSLFGN